MDQESIQPPSPNPLKWVPVVSTCIGAFALCFQVFVLYPWHLQLSSEFANLQMVCAAKGS
jgi:hypothetical protein